MTVPRITLTKRATVALGLASVLVLATGTGLALGYWSSGGSESASATVGAGSNVTVKAVATTQPSSTLVPGGAADLVLQLDNPNSDSVTIKSVQQNGDVSPSASGCDTSNAAVSVPTNSALDVAVPAGTDVVVHIPNAVSMGTGSANACQGSSFNIPVLVTVQQ